jgi:hypothetical protein
MRPPAICAIAGLGLCIAGFFLPAVRFPPDPRPEARWGPGAVSREFQGYECAAVTLVGTANFVQHPSLMAVPIVFIGWINPLLLLYLLAGAVKKLGAARPFLAGTILVGCVAMWILLAEDHVTLLAGHYLWIAGIVLILSAPLTNRLSAETQPDRNTP